MRYFKTRDLRVAGLSTAACMATLSLFSLSWTIPNTNTNGDGEAKRVVAQLMPLSPHQVLQVNGVGYTLPISDWQTIPGIPVSSIDDETLWLARCIYSETKDPREMELVAWVVRNRVETDYRGRDTYQSTVLDPRQFSAFNNDSPTVNFYTRLETHHELLGWQEALRIAYLVRTDDGRRRPFSELTRHFYSEVSMAGFASPYWSSGYTPVNPGGEFEIDERRFRFYEDIL